jgi:hypothetical protein
MSPGRVALAGAIDRAVVDDLHHVVLGLQFRATREEARDNPRLVVAPQHRSIASARRDPRAGEIIQLRIAHWRRPRGRCTLNLKNT